MSKTRMVAGLGRAALLAGVTFGFAAGANATEGYFQTGYGTIQKAQSGAGVANPEDAMALSVNPAGLVYVGRQFEAAFTLFSPHRGYEATPGMVASGSITSTQESS